MGLFNWLKQHSGEQSANHPDATQESRETSASTTLAKLGPSVTQDSDALDIEPVSTNIDGLNVGQIILIDWCNYRLKSDFLPGYFNTSYGVNPIIERNNLVNAGYIVDGNAKDALQVLKVPQLKQILKSNKLKISGKKSELIERIATTLPVDDYSAQVPPVYVASAKGIAILKKCGILPWLHKQNMKYGVTPNDLVSVLPCTENTEEYYLKKIIPVQTLVIKAQLDQHQLMQASSMAHSQSMAVLNSGGEIDDWLPSFIFSITISYCQISFYSEFDQQYSIYLEADGVSNIAWLQSDVQKLYQQYQFGKIAVKNAVSNLKYSLGFNLPFQLDSIWAIMPQVLNSLIFDTTDDAEAKRKHFVKTHVPASALH